MDATKFRICYSELIEHYQYIEGWLEFIYAHMDKETTSLDEVERVGMHRILYKIRKKAKEKGIKVFTKTEEEKITHVIQKRNFWCHDCFFWHGIFRKKWIVHPHWEQTLRADLQEAEAMRDFLFRKKTELTTHNQE